MHININTKGTTVSRFAHQSPDLIHIRSLDRRVACHTTRWMDLELSNELAQSATSSRPYGTTNLRLPCTLLIHTYRVGDGPSRCVLQQRL